MSEIVKFLINAVIISLSGVMAPGAVTAATIAQGTRSKYAGAFISIGHGIVEMPLIFLIMLGLDVVLKIASVKIGIGILGGGFLLWMGVGMIHSIIKPDFDPKNNYTAGPVTTGIVLSAGNPYFLLWWATVGLNLAMGARELGIMALVLFAVAHWLCDFFWLSILSFASNKGAKIMSPRNQRIILAVCATALFLFGIKFIYDAGLSVLHPPAA